MNSEKVYFSISVYMHCEKYVQLGNNSRKISVLVYMNNEKYVQFDSNSLKIPVLVYVNSEKCIECSKSFVIHEHGKVSILW